MRPNLICFIVWGLLISLLGADGRQRPETPSQAPAFHPTTVADIRRMLPSGKLHVDIMVIQYSDRFAELSLKLRTALEAHPDWFRAHQEEFQKPNEPPPYYPNLGLTKAEFAEFTAAMKNGPDMIKVSNGIVVVKSDGAAISLEGQGELAFLTQVRIDLTANQVVTPYGVLKTVQHNRPNAHQPGGMWDGITWKHEVAPHLPLLSPLPDASTVSLTVGKYLDGKRGTLLYGASVTRQGRSVVDTLLILNFRLAR